MRAAETPAALRDARRTELLLLVPVLVVSLLLNFTGLWWGLPNGDVTWAIDALAPMTPLAVAHHLLSRGWNSGWFFYKYPLGYPLSLTVIYAPYLLWLKVVGSLGRPMMDYPYGFTDPEQALFVLAILGRSVSALLTAAATLVWYGACREGFSRRAAWLAAWFFATMFPIVYYAHTTNVDALQVFWCVLALWGVARACRRVGDRIGIVVFGGAAAMAVSTKESAIGWVVTLPLMLIVAHLRRRRRMPEPAAWLPTGTWDAVAVAAVVFVVMNGAFINPSGVWHRAHFLSRSMPEAIQLQYAPRLSHVGTVAPKRVAAELAQLGATLHLVAVSIGWPLAIAAAIGGAVYGWRRPGIFFVMAAAGYYVISVRTFELMRPRYVLPLSIVSCALAALALDWGARRMRNATGRWLLTGLTALLVIYSGMRGVDVLRLLCDDSRYAAEQWLRATASPGASIEVYQQPAYLPRFAPSVRLAKIPFDRVSIADFVSRRPDLVVLSSAGLAGISTKYTNEVESDGTQHAERAASWRRATGQPIAFEYVRNRAFIDALEGGCLDYILAARFETTPWLAEPAIPSLAPEIRIYQRRLPETGPAAAVAAADHCGSLLQTEASVAAEKAD